MSSKTYVKVTPTAWKAIKNLYVKVTPTTWKAVKSLYVKVTPTKWVKTLGTSEAPVQKERPTLTDDQDYPATGEVGTYVKRHTGQYESYDDTQLIVNKIFYTVDTTPQTDGTTTQPDNYQVYTGTTHKISQSDAAPPPYIFYSVDEVPGNDDKTYYYFSDPVTANIGNLIDNYNRTVASGLGTASGGWIYNGPSRNTSAWSVNGSRARQPYNGADYAMQSVETGKSNQTVSVDVFGGGLGPAVWVSSANSWWTVIPTYSLDS
ncbi:hypothetical protein EBQ93_05125, partial [bacterium]|nr:hypothetical protein [bacterium]